MNQKPYLLLLSYHFSFPGVVKEIKRKLSREKKGDIFFYKGCCLENILDWMMGELTKD